MDTKFRMTVSQSLAGKADIKWRPEYNTRPGRMTAEDFWNSSAYFPVLIGVCALFLFTGHELAGMIALAAFVCYMQIVCSDLLCSILPLLLFLLLGTSYYECIGSLVSIWWILPPVAVSLLYNVIEWKAPINRGGCFKSMIAVSVAALLGGTGVISYKEYFSVISLYYVLGLGAALLLFSVIFSSNLARPRNYDIADRFASIIYAAGIFAGIVVINCYITRFEEAASTGAILYIPFRNYLTTIFLIALPIPFKYVKKNRVHIVSIIFMYCTLLFTGSRSGLVFGTFMLFSGIFIVLLENRKITGRDLLTIASFMVAAGIIIYIGCNTILSSRLVDGELFPLTDSRVMFAKQSVRDFLSNPITGIGLGNMKNSKIFIGVGGSMVWYHNYFAQIIGSMGVIGIVAYGWLLRDRFVLLSHLYRSGYAVLALSYLGMFMVSMTNPGEFCPLPNEFLVVLLFDVAEIVCVSKKERTVSGDSSCMTWYPSGRRIPVGIYNSRHKTMSLCYNTIEMSVKQKNYISYVSGNKSISVIEKGSTPER